MSLGAVRCWEDGCDNFASLYASTGNIFTAQR